MCGLEGALGLSFRSSFRSSFSTPFRQAQFFPFVVTFFPGCNILILVVRFSSYD